MKHKTPNFSYCFRYAGEKNTGRLRDSNQDEVIFCPDIGIFAVSDGMGGLEEGARASVYVRESIPVMMRFSLNEETPDAAGNAFAETIRRISDELFNAANTGSHISFGATFCGIWLYKDKAIFTNLGDSRGYLLPKYKRTLKQITEDHNIAALLVKNGELAKNAANNHPSSSRLTRFVGMNAPALPEYFVCDVAPGDRILCAATGFTAW
ncbi:PP2C family protein-serine/threonine phosphatase [Syntrophaceticus schinkii]|uniref:PPM-type phosphatase domain-containing protein n=1 Tax=Syntrophaceticus schinkii TaxID=499207 RepID=A0A0B7MI87_9FIRM|nr:serine/threonine-protein phosphatase [Syntrophaceticus schinkii]CEO87953.1 hypothetical protein SSCH_1360006 [Syntrophaceticus schinkii]